MGAQKRSSKSTNKPIPKSDGSQKPQTKEKYHTQLSAIILFAIALFMFFLSILNGPMVWGLLRTGLFWLFGVAGYIISPVLIFIAVLASKGESKTRVLNKIVLAVVFVAFVCCAIQIFFVKIEKDGLDFLTLLKQLYDNGTGKDKFCGGAFGALLASPLVYFLGKTGATIVVSLLIFVFLMIITGATLMDFLKKLLFPAKIIKQSIDKKVEQNIAKESLKFNIDVDLGPDSVIMPDHPVSSSKDRFNVIIDNFEIDESKDIYSGRDVSEVGIDTLVKKAVSTEKSNKILEQKNETPKSTADQIYKFPPYTLLKQAKAANTKNLGDEMKINAQRLVDTLKSFGVETKIVDISRGPTVTRYELQPSSGVKISKITGLADDIALNLASAGVRIEAPIPNKAAVGIEVPNKITEMVSMRSIVESTQFGDSKSKLTVALGRDISGNIITADLSTMPHILIAGATGSGKSVCINSIIISILYKASPDEVRLLMVDPKVVELGNYNGIPHLLVPVVTDPRKAAGALGWAVTEMLNRYKLFAQHGTRDLKSYNRIAKSSDVLNPLPQIVIIIDELADLMMAAPNEVEDAICRLAQMARAAGMHLIIATQRPSVDVITGVIKANIPSRIAFAVSSHIDSRTILDGGGAEKLLGRGDMLFYPIGTPKPLRVQGCFVSDKEIEDVVNYVKGNIENIYDEHVIEEIEKQTVAEKKPKNSSEGGGFDDNDEMIGPAVECILEAGQASTSFLQRKLKLGYARAARIIDELESRGIVSPADGSKPRNVLITRDMWYEMNINNVDNI